MTKAQARALEVIKEEGGIHEGAPTFRPYISNRTGARMPGRGLGVKVINALRRDGHLTTTRRPQDGRLVFSPAR